MLPGTWNPNPAQTPAAGTSAPPLLVRLTWPAQPLRPAWRLLEPGIRRASAEQQTTYSTVQYCLQGLGEQKRTKYKINGTATTATVQYSYCSRPALEWDTCIYRRPCLDVVTTTTCKPIKPGMARAGMRVALRTGRNRVGKSAATPIFSTPSRGRLDPPLILPVR